MAPILSVEQDRIAEVMKALKDEADGKALRKELNKSIRAVVEPAVGRAKQAALALPSAGGPREGGSLRQAIAVRIKSESRPAGKDTGASIRVKGAGMPRNFKLAARKMNSTKSWRHQVFGNAENWVVQSASDPGWFDREIAKDAEAYKRQILEAVEEMAERIARRSGSPLS